MEKHKFIIETGSKFDNIDFKCVINTAEENNITYEQISIDELKHAYTRYVDYIPIGTIMFIQEWLNKVHSIKRENPIEIPLYLRDKKYTKRDYRVVKACDLPSRGKYFIKSANRLKSFKYTGYMDFNGLKELFDYESPCKWFDTKLNKDEAIVLSEYDNYVYAEYRVYVINGKIVDTVIYNGNNEYKPDMNLITEMINIINSKEQYLKSYTLDVYIGKRGTALLEVHNFTSVGLYKENWGIELFQAYIDGINYILNDNKEIELG